MLGTVGKASRVLDLFTSERPEWGVTETALALEVPRSSAHDLLSTLADTGLLRRAGGNRYRLGWKLLGLSSTVLDSSEVRTHARPVMDCLVAKLGATVHLAVLEDEQVMYIDKLAAPAGPAVSLSAVGKRIAPHCSAVGKVLLAHAPRRTADAAIERSGLRAYTERTIDSADRLGFELAAVRRAGVARDREEAVPGVFCHAAPILEDGNVVAALSLSVGAAAELRLSRRLDDVARAAGIKISRSLDGATLRHAVAG